MGGTTIFRTERDYSMTDNTYCRNGFRKRLLSIEVRSPPQIAIKTMGEKHSNGTKQNRVDD